MLVRICQVKIQQRCILQEELIRLNRPIRLSFRFGDNISWVPSIEKFNLHGNQYIPTEIVNFQHHHLYENRSDVIIKWENLRAFTTRSVFIHNPRV